MPATEAIGYGSAVTIGGIAVTLINTLKLPKLSAEVIDRTVMSSPSKTRQKMGGLLNNEAASVEFNWNPSLAGHEQFRAMVGTTQAIVATLPGGQTLGFDAVIAGYAQGDITVDGKMTGSIEIDPDGVVTPTY